MDETDFQQLLAAARSELTTRVLALSPGLHSLHQQILRHFAESGHPPDVAVLQAWAAQLGVDLSDALTEMAHVDLVQADPDTRRILGAYPFVSTPRGHRVDIDGGPGVEAYCAADALGVSAMLNRAVTITSRDPHSGTEIRIAVRGGEATAEPTETVVSIPMSDAGDGRQSGDSHCPAVNFYASAANARAYEHAHGVSSELLTVAQAHQFASTVFGGLLDPDRR